MFGFYTMSIALGKTFHMIFTSISLENITKSSSNNNNNNNNNKVIKKKKKFWLP